MERTASSGVNSSQERSAPESRRESSRVGMLKVSGATEGFHRYNLATGGRSSSPSSETRSEDAAMDPGEAMSPQEQGEPVKSQTIDRTGGPPDLAGSGFHMPPEVLGRAESTSPKKDDTQQPKRSSTLADVNARARIRWQRAIEAAKSQAAAAAAATATMNTSFDVAMNSSMLTLVTYEGVEMVFANTASQTIMGVCSRTHLLLQTLHLVSTAPVVSITSNSVSGMIVVVHQDGMLQTYRPVPTNPGEPETTDSTKLPAKETAVPPTAFGKFLWVDCHVVEAGQVFYQSDEKVVFGDRRTAEAGQLVDVSTSDDKLLIAHRNQLAVFEIAQLNRPEGTGSENDETPTGSENDKTHTPNSTGTLLWTTMMPSNVVTAKIAGDGQALVVVLEEPEEDGSFGARTFLHDIDDGSLGQTTKPMLERGSSVGMVFRSGPFLKHAAPITRISFRGLGRITSTAMDADEYGNDLLLTYCAEDSAVRIFNQNSWNQLMHWVAPPDSRADWIRGSSAFSLGDLESQKKPKNAGSRAVSRRPSAASTSDMSAGAAINAGLQSTRSLGAGSPTTPAGAWIAEVTFQGAFPALRLSRLSYMKRGNDDSQPAHFESVTAILPAGSIVAGSVLDADDMGMAIQGIWPAWNPWLSETTEEQTNDTLSGSAMQFLGLSSVSPPHSTYLGESYLGGTHSPPTELRIAAAHPSTGNVVIMEFPLWGDEDYGAMELGSPVRSVLSLSDVDPHPAKREGSVLPSASIDYESSRLCAQVDHDQREISLLWRKQGSLSLYSDEFRQDESLIRQPIREVAEPSSPATLQDWSITPVPLALPPLRLPSGTSTENGETIVAIKWWPDDSFGGPPLLLAVTQSAKLYVFEIPPPWSVREPAMPNYEPFTLLPNESVDVMNDGLVDPVSEDEDELDVTREEYDVSVTPHPDFGLGLRLESPMDGLPAVAGSFKKHPLNGGMLPAEKTEMIQLGDEVLSVNGVSLENMTFDDIIGTVRHVGAEAGPGQPLTLRFRPSPPERTRKNSAALQDPFNTRQSENVLSSDHDAQSVGRRVSPKPNERKGARNSDCASLASLLVGSSGEAQQEFGRVIAVIQDVIPSAIGQSVSERMLILPWGSGVGAPSPKKLRGAALVAFVEGSRVYARRVELSANSAPEKSRIVHLGEVDLAESEQGSDDDNVEIQTIQFVETAGERRCFAIADKKGCTRLLFMNITNEKSSSPHPLTVTFEYYNIFSLGADSCTFNMSCATMSLFAILPKHQDDTCRRTLKIWSARPDPSSRRMKDEKAIRDTHFDQDYVETEVPIEPTQSSSRSVVDFCFLRTGFLDSFPSLLVCWESEAAVYQRRGVSQRWLPVFRFLYSWVPSSTPTGQPTYKVPSDSPRDSFPHLLSMTQAALSSFDEWNYSISDWHPQSLLAQICTDDRGASVALKKHVRRTLLWLADLTDPSSVENRTRDGPLLVAPFEAVGGTDLIRGFAGEGAAPPHENAASLFAPEASGAGGELSAQDEEQTKLARLLAVLSNPRKPGKKSGTAAHESVDDSRSDVLPSVLSNLPPDTLRVLWAITELCSKPPKFGKLDPSGQLALTVFCLHDSLRSSPRQEGTATHSDKPTPQVSSFMVKRKSANDNSEKNKLPPQSSSAGCASALFSDYQGQLIDCIRKPGKKLDWQTVRETRMPFWVRSDSTLSKIAEEVGQAMYRESRDILKAAIFFLAAGKRRTLKNLAAADSTDSGKKFYKFVTSFDFSSERGRRAAEKNAFSLLRKTKYDSAAAFFLLAEPPILKSAVETIATKMEDLDLAFMVARLIGNSQASSSQQGTQGLGNTMMGFGGLGGGGGYAGSGVNDLSDVQKDEESFDQWKPKVGVVAQDLILDRCMPNSYSDASFAAVLLLWLGKHDESAHWMSGFLECPDGFLPGFASDVSVKRLQHTSSAAKKTGDPIVSMTNYFVDFAAGPFLLKQMKACTRTRIASVLLVSSSLSRIGVELPAFQLLSRSADPGIFLSSREPSSSPIKNGSGARANNSAPIPSGISRGHTANSNIFDSFDPAPPTAPKPNSSGAMASSIFDSYNAPPAPAPKTNPPGAVASSIFDSYDAAPPAPAAKTNSSGAMASSIFDSFDAPPAPAPKTNPPGAVASSIFDSYDAAPPAPAAKTNSSGAMASSIFDSYDAPPAPAPKTIPSGAMASSIFDSYDAAPPAPAAKTNSSGAMASSIFDSYDAPPAPAPAAKTNSSGAMASSIFDSYDAPPAPAPAAKTNSSGAMASSIFDSYDAPPAPAPKTNPSGAMASSIFDSYDATPPPAQSSNTAGGMTPAQQTSKGTAVAVEGAATATTIQAAAAVGSASVDTKPKEAQEEPVRPPPSLWLAWREDLMITSASRRLLRELASLGARFHIDAFEPVMSPSGTRKCALIPSDAAQVLQFHCDGEGLLGEVNNCVKLVCQSFNLEKGIVVRHALRLLEAPYQYYRVCVAVLLHLAVKKADLAEDVVRNTATSLVEKCNQFALSNDRLSSSRLSVSHVSSLHLRRVVAHYSWQLEVCLWMHRGGALPLSGLALNETICAVRVGLLIASWNRDFEALETVIRQPPDCLVDEDTGRQLWTSLKQISSSVSGSKKPAGASSGGWEFLVDCRRAEATGMLRPRQTGCFIIRPHPEDHGVFTLSFKTNLVPSGETEKPSEDPTAASNDGQRQTPNESKPVKRDDVVQHAIIRLSDSGFRCGSFGPFATLMKLLDAVSSSLPFNLRFDLPPTEGVIKDEGSKPSPNSALFRKLGLVEGTRALPPHSGDELDHQNKSTDAPESDAKPTKLDQEYAERRKRFGLFLELLVLSEVRKQLSSVAASKYDAVAWSPSDDDVESLGVYSGASFDFGQEQEYAVAARMLRPLLAWCRMMEVGIVGKLAPRLKQVSKGPAMLPVALNASETAIEISTTEVSSGPVGGDAVIRRMIQPGSGVGFKTLRLGDGGESAMVVLFSKREAVDWFLRNGVEKSEEDALGRLALMEESRVIEPVDLKLLAPKAYKKTVNEEDEEEAARSEVLKKIIRYRLVDPWEVEPLESREAETRGASLGRHRFLAFSLGRVSSSSESIFRSLGGSQLLEVWAAGRGGVSLTKAVATILPPWERDAGGDLHLHDGTVEEPNQYDNSIRQHLYRNSLFRRLGLPQRFLALIQVELLDLKNLTSPGGSLSLSVYALLRLKRPRSTAPLTNKARTLDSVATHPKKLVKATGPNAPASWGNLVRFRFPLPEDTASDGRSYDGDREALFKGPPSVLQVTVYEKKFMSDTLLGRADVKLDGLRSGGQLEEWVPLRTESHGINWFARIRLTLRFELMCLSPQSATLDGSDDLAPSVGLRRIEQLSHIGGAHEEIRRSVSQPDLLSYFESMVS